MSRPGHVSRLRRFHSQRGVSQVFLPYPASADALLRFWPNALNFLRRPTQSSIHVRLLTTSFRQRYLGSPGSRWLARTFCFRDFGRPSIAGWIQSFDFVSFARNYSHISSRPEAFSFAAGRRVARYVPCAALAGLGSPRSRFRGLARSGPWGGTQSRPYILLRSSRVVHGKPALRQPSTMRSPLCGPSAMGSPSKPSIVV